MKINVLAIVPALIPSINIGIIKPMLYLQTEGKVSFELTLPSSFNIKMLNDINCVVFCRNSSPPEEWILNEVCSRKIPYIYEIDDDFFEIPYDTLLGRIHRHPTNLNTLINFLKYASVVRTYSPLLAENVKKVNENVEINTVYFDMQLLERIVPKKSDKLKIIYATSRIADEQQAIFNEALKKIAIDYKEKVEIYFWGAPITDEFLENQENVFYLPPIDNYEKFIKKFYEMGFDIGLAPIFEGRFFNSKTNNKYREYGGCKIAGIYSDEDLYRNCINDEENGLLIQNSADSWFKGIKKLILDENLRKKIITNASMDIEENYSFEHYCQIWEASLRNTTIVNSLSSLNMNSLLKHNSIIQVCFIYDELDEKLELLKIKLKHEIYVNSKIKIINEFRIFEDSLDTINSIFENSQNFCVFSNNKNLIFMMSKLNKNIVFITSKISNKTFSHQSFSFILLNISHYSLNIFEHFSNNLYIEIDSLFKHYFVQSNNVNSLNKSYNQIKRRFKMKVLSFVYEPFVKAIKVISLKIILFKINKKQGDF